MYHFNAYLTADLLCAVHFNVRTSKALVDFSEANADVRILLLLSCFNLTSDKKHKIKKLDAWKKAGDFSVGRYSIWFKD